jgi:hypothetical protein
MADPNARIFQRLMSDLGQVVGRSFDEAADEILQRVKNVAEELQDDFSYDINDAIGSDGTPPELGIEWPELTLDWWDYKASKGLSVPGYYLGIKQQYPGFLSRNIRQIAGEPQVFFSSPGGGGQRQEAGGQVRDIRTGRFARRIELPRQVTLNVRLFPKFNSSDDVIDRFGGGRGRRSSQKIAAGEYGSRKWNRSARPFLTAFELYYSRIKLDQAMKRTLA